MLTNLFPIENANKLSCSFRRWEVKGLTPDKTDFERNRIALRYKVSSDVKGPAEVILDGDKLIVAVPENYKEPQPTYSLMPYVVKLNPLEQGGVVNFSSADYFNRTLAQRFLQSVLVDRLRREEHEHGLWQPKAGRPFFSKQPSNANDAGRIVDVHEGFSFRVTYVADIGYCVLVDSTVRYALTNPWPEIITADKRHDFLRQGGAAQKPDQQGLIHCVYHFGNQWYEVMVQTVLKETIGEALFLHPNTNQPISVYDYTLEKWSDKLPKWAASISPTWTAIAYITWKGQPARHGAAHLCFPVVQVAQLDRLGLSWLHSQHSIKRPLTRLNAARRFVRYWERETELAGEKVVIARTPLKTNRRTFFIPKLEFGGQQIIDVSQIRLSDYPSQRMRTLQDPNGGFWKCEALSQQWVMVSSAISNSIWPALRKDLEFEIRRFCGQVKDYSPKVITYEDLGQGLFSQAKAIDEAIVQASRRQHEMPTGYCLAILPQNAHPELPAYLTSKLARGESALHMACIHQDSFAGFYKQSSTGDWALDRQHPETGRIRGYIRNVAIKLLLVNNLWPFVFAGNEERLCSTLYIGVDVLNFVAGFTLLGAGGRICYFVSTESEEEELISSRKMHKILKDYIPRLKDAHNGLITNDKFCMSRSRQLPLAWSRRPLRLRGQDIGESAYPPDETAHCGGAHETSLENSPRNGTEAGRAATLGPGIPAPSAMGKRDPNSLFQSDAGGIS